MGEKTNRYFSDKLEKTVTSNELKKIFLLDLTHGDMKSYKIDKVILLLLLLLFRNNIIMSQPRSQFL